MNTHERQIQVFTGKRELTTLAAIGTAMRSSGYGLRVIIFTLWNAKGVIDDFELLKKYSNIQYEVYDNEGSLNPKQEKGWHQIVLRTVQGAITSGKYDLVVLSEISTLIESGVLKPKDIIKAIKTGPPTVELILADERDIPGLTDEADLVTKITDCTED